MEESCMKNESEIVESNVVASSISKEITEDSTTYEAIPVLVENPNVSGITYTQALKQLVRHAAPYTGSSFVVIGGNFIGVIMISRIGSQALAASNLTSSIQNWLTSTVGATLASTAVVAGRKFGNQELTEIGPVLHKSWFLTWLLSVPAVTIILTSKYMLSSLGQDPQIVSLAGDYFDGYIWGLPAMFMLSCNRRIALATSNASVGLFFDIFYQVFDATLSYSLIFGKFYLPKLGFAGLGYSNSITAWATFSFFTIYIANSNKFKPYNITKFNAGNFFSEFLKLAKIGLPVGAKVGVELAAVLAAGLMIGTMGPEQQAVQEASFQYIFILSTPMYSLMDAVGALVSRSVGEKNIQNAKKIGYVGIGLGTSISMVGLALFATIPNILLSAFIDLNNPVNKEIVKTARIMMLVNGAGQVADSVRNISSGGLSGFYDTLIPTALIISTQVFIYIPLSYTFGFPLDMQAVGVMTARDISLAVGATLLFSRWVMTNKIPTTKLGNLNESGYVETDITEKIKTEESDLLTTLKTPVKKLSSTWTSFFGLIKKESPSRACFAFTR
jgi:MATE family multidrug resistance protein